MKSGRNRGDTQIVQHKIMIKSIMYTIYLPFQLIFFYHIVCNNLKAERLTYDHRKIIRDNIVRYHYKQFVKHMIKLSMHTFSLPFPLIISFHHITYNDLKIKSLKHTTMSKRKPFETTLEYHYKH